MFMKFLHYIFIFLLFIKPPVYALDLANSDISSIQNFSQIKVGDWIFRNGVQIDSFIVKKLDGSDYSHIGLSLIHI